MEVCPTYLQWRQDCFWLVGGGWIGFQRHSFVSAALRAYSDELTVNCIMVVTVTLLLESVALAVVSMMYRG